MQFKEKCSSICATDYPLLISLSMTESVYYRNPVVKFSFTKTVVGQQISPEVAFFSSRGPSSLSPTVLKVLPLGFFHKIFCCLLITQVNRLNVFFSLTLLLLGLTSWPPGPLFLPLLHQIFLRIKFIHLTSKQNQEPLWLVPIYLASLLL